MAIYSIAICVIPLMVKRHDLVRFRLRMRFTEKHLVLEDFASLSLTYRIL